MSYYFYGTADFREQSDYREYVIYLQRRYFRKRRRKR